MTSRLVLYAPNVHTGGGFVLLQALLDAWPAGAALTALLDDRAREVLNLPHDAQVVWVAASVGSRLAGEFALRRAATRGTTVLCFHGLPPLLPNAARVVVFQQNRNYFGLNALSQFSFKTRLRLGLERFVSRTFRHRVSQYIVQTPSMQRILRQWYAALGGVAPRVRVLPFFDALDSHPAIAGVHREWDFVYVADGEAHKNHRNLLQAWQLLARENLKPSLALTLSPRDEVLKQEIAHASEVGTLEIKDLGQISRADVLRLYAHARALIFPSTSESFGLPLVEASQLRLPILASELDYVRDVCVPVETFDPNSPVSIARAVRRFLECPEPAVTLVTPAEFWSQLLRGDDA